MTPINMFVPGDPKGQPRPRAFYRKGLGVRVYDAGTAEGWKSQVALALRDHGTNTTDESVCVGMQFIIRRPKSHYRKSGELTKAAPAHHTAKPDIDNLAKAVLDAMSQLGIWRDDAQVDELSVAKRWTQDQTERPGCYICIAVGART